MPCQRLLFKRKPKTYKSETQIESPPTNIMLPNNWQNTTRIRQKIKLVSYQIILYKLLSRSIITNTSYMKIFLTNNHELNQWIQCQFMDEPTWKNNVSGQLTNTSHHHHWKLKTCNLPPTWFIHNHIKNLDLITYDKIWVLVHNNFWYNQFA